MNKRRLFGIFGMAAFAMLLWAGSALAAWFVTGRTINLLTVQGFKTEIQETYENPGIIYPSQEISKVVHVKNTGSCDAIIRVRVEVAFGDLDGEGVFHRDQEVDGSCIRLHYDSTGLWKRMEDGYFYYTQVLKAGERTKVPLIDSYTLAWDAPARVRGKEGRIFVYMESIQAEGEAYKTWFEGPVDLSYAYESAATAQEPVAVRFLGVKDGFEFAGRESDLFASFRLLTPGCCRQQRIEIENKSLLSTEIYLKAEPMEGENLTEEEKKLIEELLTRYVAISLQDKGGELYRGRMDGGRIFLEEEKKVLSSYLSSSFVPFPFLFSSSPSLTSSSSSSSLTSSSSSFVSSTSSSSSSSTSFSSPNPLLTSLLYEKKGDSSEKTCAREEAVMRVKGEPENGPKTLEEPIRLGSFLPGQTRHLVMTLAVSPLMDNRYQKVLAKVRWVFTASGGNGEYPNTGDASKGKAYLILLGAALLLEVLSLGIRRGRNRRRERG